MSGSRARGRRRQRARFAFGRRAIAPSRGPLGWRETLDLPREQLLHAFGREAFGLGERGDDEAVEERAERVALVTGVLVRATPDALALRRRSPDVGDTVVHFPRAGYRITRAGEGTG